MRNPSNFLSELFKELRIWLPGLMGDFKVFDVFEDRQAFFDNMIVILRPEIFTWLKLPMNFR